MSATNEEKDESELSALLGGRLNRMRVSKISNVDFPKDRPFLAIWEDGEEIDGIEWLVFIDGNCFMNLNSSNINRFGRKDEMPMFTAWCSVPDLSA